MYDNRPSKICNFCYNTLFFVECRTQWLYEIYVQSEGYVETLGVSCAQQNNTYVYMNMCTQKIHFRFPTLKRL
jgi:hypothetical protein